MHESLDPTPCPTCDGEDEACWHCKGSGLMDPDGAVREQTPGVFIECPTCKNLMARRRDKQPSLFCGRCGHLGFDDEAVLRDPSILES